MNMLRPFLLLCFFAGSIMPSADDGFNDDASALTLKGILAKMTPEERFAYDREKLDERFKQASKDYRGVGVVGLCNHATELKAFEGQVLTDAQKQAFVDKVDAIYECGRRLNPRLEKEAPDMQQTFLKTFASCVPEAERYAWLERVLDTCRDNPAEAQKWRDACAKYYDLPDDIRTLVYEARGYVKKAGVDHIHNCLQQAHRYKSEREVASALLSPEERAAAIAHADTIPAVTHKFAFQSAAEVAVENRNKALVAAAQCKEEAKEAQAQRHENWKAETDALQDRRNALVTSGNGDLADYYDGVREFFENDAKAVLLTRLEAFNDSFKQTREAYIRSFIKCSSSQLATHNEQWRELNKGATQQKMNVYEREEKVRWYEECLKDPVKYATIQARSQLVLDVRAAMIAEKEQGEGVTRDLATLLDKRYEALPPAINQPAARSLSAKIGNFPWMITGTSLCGLAVAKVIHEYYTNKPTDKNGKKLSLLAYGAQELASGDYKKLSFILKMAGVGALGFGAYYSFNQATIAGS